MKTWIGMLVVTVSAGLGCLEDEPGVDASDARETGDADGEMTGGEIGESDIDRIDAQCGGGRIPVAMSCGPATVSERDNLGQAHIPDGTPITYEEVPPSSGDHRPAWARWGEYDYLPPQRWLHNLEHGGIAFLYDPCASESVIASLRESARAQAEDEGGPFRWVMTPYPGLPSVVAVVAWQAVWEAECLDDEVNASLQSFIDARYRAAPEDVASDGSYATGWIGR